MSKTNLARRLDRLESQLTDGSGLAPGSDRWLEYWTDQAYRRVALNEPGPRIPIEVFDIILHRDPAER